MLLYIVKRFAEVVMILFFIATATFFLTALVPGNPIAERVERLPAATRENLYRRYGLDKPLGQRYLITMRNLLQGDFGESIIYPGQTVQSILRDKWQVSARLGLQQLILGIGVGLFLGIIAAVKKGSPADYFVVFFCVLLVSVPHLIFGLLLQKVFGGTFALFPVIGWPKGGDLWLGGWNYTILPTLTGCFSYIAAYARLLKTSMLDVLNQDYILTARAKGLTEWQIIRRHVLRNAFVPIVTKLPMSLAMCVTGSFFIERVFAIPGIGMYYVNAVNQRDIPIIMGETVILAILFMAVIFITDILYSFIDPRIRLKGPLRAEKEAVHG
ncbi:MAG: ABC transporter permease [Treponema sp.]|jgi:oligopeptide transport system permease protein|nr:ABC transporter permease [Treponema sp.]